MRHLVDVSRAHGLSHSVAIQDLSRIAMHPSKLWRFPTSGVMVRAEDQALGSIDASTTAIVKSLTNTAAIHIGSMPFAFQRTTIFGKRL